MMNSIYFNLRSKVLVELLWWVFKWNESTVSPSSMTWHLKEPSNCLHSIILTENTFAYFCVWASWLGPSWDWGWAGVTIPGLCVGAEGAPTRPFLFFFECSPQVGWAQDTFKNFPRLGCFLSCSVSPVWREVSRTVGGGGKTERNIVQGLAVWAAQRKAVY